MFKKTQLTAQNSVTATAKFAGAGLLCAFLASTSIAADLPNTDLTNNGNSQKTLDIFNPKPLHDQQASVDGWNFQAGITAGAVGGYSNHMLVVSVTGPLPFFPKIGMQRDLAVGMYRDDYTSAASGMHIFYREKNLGMFGIYGDWGYVDNEHGGRVGVELSSYQDRWSVDVLAGVRFGQHFLTEFTDEVDLSYYFTDNFKASVGHRLTSRGHVGNVGFEYAASNNGWTVYGEAEIGEDDYDAAWAGVRYAFGSSRGKSLMQRDRESSVKVRIPRNIASVTQCGDTPNGHKSWNGFKTSNTINLCGDKDTLAQYGATISKANSK